MDGQFLQMLEYQSLDFYFILFFYSSGEKYHE